MDISPLGLAVLAILVYFAFMITPAVVKYARKYQEDPRSVSDITTIHVDWPLFVGATLALLLTLYGLFARNRYMTGVGFVMVGVLWFLRRRRRTP